MSIRHSLVPVALLGLFYVRPGHADPQVAPAQTESRVSYTAIPYTELAIRNFVETEFAKSTGTVVTEPVVEILVRDLAKDGAGGFRIAPAELGYTFEYRRVGDKIQIDKITDQ